MENQNPLEVAGIELSEYIERFKAIDASDPRIKAIVLTKLEETLLWLDKLYKLSHGSDN